MAPMEMDKFVTSFAQQRLWFLDQYEPGSSVYNIPAACRLQGRLDSEALRQSLDEIVRRHEAFRTTFAVGDGAPIQIIAPSVRVPLVFEDLSGCAQAESEAQRLAQREAGLPFDLANGPLMRAHLFKLADNDHMMLLTLHHIIADGWSIAVLLRELSEIYNAQRERRVASLVPLEIQYADYSVWQRQWLQFDVLEAQTRYWKGTLEGAAPLLELPLDRPRPAFARHRGASVEFSIDHARVAQLRKLSQRCQSALFAILAAALNVLLSRYSGQNDICIGYPVANRTKSELESVIGFFVNTLVLRTRVDRHEPFDSLVRRVRDAVLEASDHQDLPFEKLVEALRPERSFTYSPLFQVMLAFYEADPLDGLQLAELTATGIPIRTETAKFDLSVELRTTHDGVTGFFEYDTDLFDRETIEALAQHYGAVLEAVAANPDSAVGDLALLSEAQRRALLVRSSGTQTSWDGADTLWAAFEAQAERSPDAVAVGFEQEQLSYRELNARANRLAHALRQKGVGADSLVAVCLERSIDMVVSLLAVLKAGGGYVPLDPSYPAERLAYLLEDTSAAALITHAPLAAALGLKHRHMMCVDEERMALAGHPDHNPEPASGAAHLAYCIYTSGSTGQPKGVLNTHGAIMNRLRWMQGEYGLSQKDTVLQKTPFAFDVSVWEFFWPLLNGARLVVAKPDGHKDPAYLAETLRRHRVTIVHFVPSMLQAFLAARPDMTDHALRHVFCSGEALPHPLQEQFHSALASVPLHNLYGPTEAAVDVTYWRCEQEQERGVAAASPVVPIGRPVANTQMYVLDEALDPVPFGVAGDLYIGGVQLARGYLGRPDLTAQKFVPDPFGSAGSRLYMTGDRALCRRDGVIEYLGRSDDQVKLRGLRIELGEIECVLREHEHVQAAAVVACTDGQGEMRLVGYVVAHAGMKPEAAQLRAHLQRRLPEYMVPGTWVWLDALPLSANGKLERKRLPAPDFASRTASAPYVAPRTATEALLASIWAEVLGLERVSIDDDFFELGGHSLLATQVVARVREALNTEVPLKLIFEAPSLRAFAVRLDQSPALAETAICAHHMGPGMQPASFAQERLYFLSQLKPEDTAYIVPMAFELTSSVDAEALARSVEHIAQRHETLRTTFEADAEGRTVAIVHAKPLSALQLDDLRSATDIESRVRAEMACIIATAFDLERGPLMRARLLRTADDRYVLLVAMHHIVTDAWSAGVLMREICAHYASFSSGREPSYSPLPIQYGDYARWQREQIAGPRGERQIRYWKARLAGAPTTIELPTDRPRPPMQTSRGKALRRTLDIELSREIARLSRACGVTPFMTLFAAFNVLLSRYSSQHDLVVGTPIANRTRAETESLIGFFTNTLALRTDLSGEPTFREVVARVKDATLSAYEHQDLPFEKIVEALEVPRDTSRSPVFQVLFSLDNTPASRLELTGLHARALEFEWRTAKFDLSVETTRAATGEYVCRWEFNADLYDEASIERMAQHWTALLAAACAQPDTVTGRLPLLGEQEYADLTQAPNATARELRPVPVQRLFDEVAERIPTHIAVKFNDEQLTYEALQQRANRFARYLRRQGVAPHSLVGICLERSLDIAVAVLGVMKAGAACVPMDPSYPADRLRFMAEDAQAPLIVTQVRLSAGLAATGARLLTIDDCAAAWRESAADLGLDVDLQTRCYVLYTSGSTGQPKGAALPHAMLTNLVQWQLTESSLPAGARTLQFSPLSFDVSFDELFSTWAAGGTVVMVTDEVRKDPHRLLALVVREQIARLFVPYVALQGIADAARDLDSLGSLKEIVCGGEQLQVTDEIIDLFRKIRGGLLHNQYGPTESHFVTGHRLSGDPAVWPRLPPIGKPIFNSEIYILDAYLQPVPRGVRGDLYIAGVAIAQCYWRRGDLTAERFIPNPFCSTPGARMYRTGDVARYLPDGSIEYLGRSDHQVKVRGFRIELAEIEHAMTRIDAVAAAAATVREDRPGLKRLVGYIVPKPGMACDFRSLKEELSRHLPEYMIPAAIVQLDRLPLTPSGKIDRRSLPTPVVEAYAAAYVAPRTQREQQLSLIWSQVLDVERVGVDDDFFELGGHSLLAAQVLARIRKTCGVAVALRSLFEAPTVAKLAASMDRACSGEQHIGPAPAGVRIPLLPAQQQLWFLEQLEPGGAAYHIPISLVLKGRLDIDALQRALRAIVARHAMLRTAIVVEEGEPEPYQLVRDASAWQMAYENLGEVINAEAALKHRIDEKVREPFSLENGEMLRAVLFAVRSDHHMLLLNAHHVAADGWSIGVLLREMQALYGAYAAGRDDPLAPLPIQFGDFAWWQSNAEPADASELAYWKKRLAGAPLVHSLPLSFPRPAVLRMRGATVTTHISAPLARALLQVSSQEGATLFMGLHAVLAALLRRYGNQEDVVIGTPAANRRHVEIEPLIGMFVNTVALRSDLSGDPNFIDLLRQSRESTLDAFAHQQIPFAQVVEALGLARTLSYAPLVQIMLVLENGGHLALTLPDLSVRAQPVHTGTAKFDLTVYVCEGADEELEVTWEYNCAIFDRSFIEQFAEHYESLLAAALRAPDVPLTHLPLLSAAERRQSLHIEPADGKTFDVCCLHESFERAVRTHPDAIAVVCGAARLSYIELDQRANRLARHLIECGARPDTLVGLCVERSIEMIVGILAILKAGAAYVPLDPEYPPARLEYILRDSAARIVVAKKSLADRLPRVAHETATLLWLDDDDLLTQLSRLPATSIPAQSIGLRPDHLAYVIYTSGSTGEPKGVLVEHRQVSRLLSATEHWFGFGTDDVWTVFHSYAFDFSVWEMWGALAYGGRAVIVPYLVARSPRDFMALLETERVTVLNQTPTAFRAFSQEVLASEAGLSLRYVIFGGEALDVASLAPWFERFGDRRPQLVNMYGITETTVHVTAHVLSLADGERGTSMIGKPMPDLRVYVLDDRGEPVPTHVQGELYVAGAGVARGYLNKPELTEARFLLDRFGRAGERMYRTGDLGRYRGDGTLEYLGRKDQQVKIRGFRIELGEIQAALSQIEACAQALVIASPSVSGTGDRLVAYVVPKAGEQVDVASLREKLAQRLPDYMIPAAFCMLNSLPLTSNGKIDVKALPQPGFERGAQSTAFVEARTPTAKLLCAIWSDVLHIDRVGENDDFFSLGGDSMLAVTVVQAARRAGLALSVRDLYQHHTVAELSRIADTAAGGGAPSGESALPLPAQQRALVHAELDDIYPLTAMQRKMVRGYDRSVAVGDGVYHVQLWWRIRHAQPCDASMKEALRIVVQSQPVLRTRLLRTEDGQIRQGVLKHRDVALDVHDLRGRTAAQKKEVFGCLLEADRRSPLFGEADGFGGQRFQWFYLDDDEFIFLISTHHAIDDGWGNQHFLRSLWHTYECARLGQATTPPQAAQNVFKEYVALTQECEADEATQSFWRGRRLVKSDMGPATARAAQARTDTSGRCEYSVEFPADSVQRLYRVGAVLKVSVKAILLAAYIAMIEKSVQLDRTTIGVVASGRTDRLSDPLGALGLFWNLLPVSSSAADARMPSVHIQRVHEALIETDAHALFPLDRIEEMHGADALFFATFNFTNFHNAFSLSEATDMGLLEMGWHDRFDYPLNCHVGMDRDRQSLRAHFSFDIGWCTREEVSRWSEDYRSLLNRYLSL